jgi:hypothetical protein
LEGKSLYGVRVAIVYFLTEAPENGTTETKGTGVWPAYKITKSLVCVVGTQHNNQKKSSVT